MASVLAANDHNHSHRNDDEIFNISYVHTANAIHSDSTKALEADCTNSEKETKNMRIFLINQS